MGSKNEISVDGAGKGRIAKSDTSFSCVAYGLDDRKQK